MQALTTQNKTNSHRNMWVACWGYDQTQYSIYEEISRKGHFVIVRAFNSWGCLDAGDLCAGSTVKISPRVKSFEEYTEEEREKVANELGWPQEARADWYTWRNWQHLENKEREDKAPARKIVKVEHEPGKYGKLWIWTLDDGGKIKQADTNYNVRIVDAWTRRKITRGGYYGPDSESIRIDSCIRAHLDHSYWRNAKKYEEQNEYTAYNGR